MKMLHRLKAWPEFFDAVARGDKTFEVRLNDRGFKVGDDLLLIRWQPAPEMSGGGYETDRDGLPYWENDTNRADILLHITYVMPGGRFGIDPQWCVIGFRKDDSKGTNDEHERGN